MKRALEIVLLDRLDRPFPADLDSAGDGDLDAGPRSVTICEDRCDTWRSRSFKQLKLRSMIKNAEQATGAIPAALADVRVSRR